jgi:sulfur carrier protein
MRARSSGANCGSFVLSWAAIASNPLHKMVSITLNGASYLCRAPGQCVSDLIRELALEVKRIAIERNGEIVPRSKHSETVLVDGDKIEVVAAVGGG